jgi:hypothetical protein
MDSHILFYQMRCPRVALRLTWKCYLGPRTSWRASREWPTSSNTWPTWAPRSARWSPAQAPAPTLILTSTTRWIDHPKLATTFFLSFLYFYFLSFFFVLLGARPPSPSLLCYAMLFTCFDGDRCSSRPAPRTPPTTSSRSRCCPWLWTR